MPDSAEISDTLLLWKLKPCMFVKRDRAPMSAISLLLRFSSVSSVMFASAVISGIPLPCRLSSVRATRPASTDRSSKPIRSTCSTVRFVRWERNPVSTFPFQLMFKYSSSGRPASALKSDRPVQHMWRSVNEPRPVTTVMFSMGILLMSR